MKALPSLTRMDAASSNSDSSGVLERMFLLNDRGESNDCTRENDVESTGIFFHYSKTAKKEPDPATHATTAKTGNDKKKNEKEKTTCCCCCTCCDGGSSSTLYCGACIGDCCASSGQDCQVS